MLILCLFWTIYYKMYCFFVLFCFVFVLFCFLFFYFDFLLSEDNFEIMKLTKHANFWLGMYYPLIKLILVIKDTDLVCFL